MRILRVTQRLWTRWSGSPKVPGWANRPPSRKVASVRQLGGEAGEGNLCFLLFQKQKYWSSGRRREKKVGYFKPNSFFWCNLAEIMSYFCHLDVATCRGLIGCALKLDLKESNIFLLDFFVKQIYFPYFLRKIFIQNDFKKYISFTV